VAIPYTLKFLWSPFMDNLPSPLFSWLGRRRGWLVFSQIMLIGAIILLACINPQENVLLVAIAALFVAFASACQDIVVDAYRVEIAGKDEQGQSATMIQIGYRIGMIVSSAGSLYLAHYYGWQATYLFMAAIASIGVLTSLLAHEPVYVGSTEQLSFYQKVIEPFIDFSKRDKWAIILLFIILYKLADAFIAGMTSPFFVELGFTKPQIASIVKIYGTAASFAGIFFYGFLVTRFSVIRLLFFAGLLHAITNLMYCRQAVIGADSDWLTLSIICENFTGGIGASAFVAFLGGLCNIKYTATQYALLSSLAAFGRTWFAVPAGYVAKILGWEWFFAFAAMLALPGLILLLLIKDKLK
ncbi:MAG: MFS transporter, partial [Pseudomonadota bacterium]